VASCAKDTGPQINWNNDTQIPCFSPGWSMEFCVPRPQKKEQDMTTDKSKKENQIADILLDIGEMELVNWWTKRIADKKEPQSSDTTTE
jgi:hypothetical protein